MSTSHNGGNIQPGLDLEEHDGNLNAKRVSLASAPTIYVGPTSLLASSNFIGLASVTGTMGGVFVSTASTWVDGGRGIFRGNVRGAGLYDLETLIAGEDLTNSVLKVEGQFSYSTFTSASTAVTKSAAGLLHTINVGAVSCPSIIIYDNTVPSGTVIARLPVNAPIATYTYDVKFNTGLSVDAIAGSGGVAPFLTIGYR